MANYLETSIESYTSAFPKNMKYMHFKDMQMQAITLNAINE